MLVLRGACANVGDEGLPYGPIVEILGQLVRELDPERLETVVGTSGADLARLVPALDPGASGAPLQQAWLQARLFDALVGVLRRLAAVAPVLVLIEDVHWSDPATRETLGFLVRTLRSERVLVAMTLRSDELHRRHPALPWLGELERTGRMQRLSLSRLTKDQTAALLEAIEGVPTDPDLVARIHRRSDGNPFFIEELLLAEAEPSAGGLPSTLREILLARLASVPEDVHHVLGVVAVAGRRIDHDLLVAIAGAADSPDRLEAALRAAIASQILVVDTPPQGSEGYAFRHALLAEVAYDELLPGERRRLHRECALALEAHPSASAASKAAHRAELAHHWAAARDDERAFAASLAAAEAAGEAFAFETAHAQYERALDLWPDVADPVAVSGGDRAELIGAHGDGGLPRRLDRIATVALQREADGGDRCRRRPGPGGRDARAAWPVPVVRGRLGGGAHRARGGDRDPSGRPALGGAGPGPVGLRPAADAAGPVRRVPGAVRAGDRHRDAGRRPPGGGPRAQHARASTSSPRAHVR